MADRSPSLRSSVDEDLEKQDVPSPTPSSPISEPQTAGRNDLSTVNLNGSLPLDEKESFKVDWYGADDPENPRNFPLYRKCWITLQLALLALAPVMGSSIISPADRIIAQEFHINPVLETLAIALFELGFAIGPLLWGPVSELFGRKLSLVPALSLMAIFSIGAGFSQSPAALFLTRFFAGWMGAATVSNTSPVFSDLYEPGTRGMVSTLYAIAVCGGPTLGPVIGAALTVTVGWRWTQWLLAICSFAIFSLALFTMPETYNPVLLSRRAKRLRKETGDARYWHPHEYERFNLQRFTTKYLIRPLDMLISDTIMLFMALYASYVYAFLYLALGVFPIVYQDQRGYGLVVGSLPFLSTLVGVILSTPIVLANQPRYRRICAAHGGKPVPEARLLPMMAGGVFFVLGLFWFGWTAAPQYHWAIPTVAVAFIGAGFNIVFLQCINYLIDTYGSAYGSSAVAAYTFTRSGLAAAAPIYAGPMFKTLGVPGGMSLLGGIAALALPVPLLFMKYGEQIRKRGKFASRSDAK